MHNTIHQIQQEYYTHTRVLCIYAQKSGTRIILVLYLMIVFCYALNILIKITGIQSLNLGGLQADINGGVWGVAAPPKENKK